MFDIRPDDLSDARTCGLLALHLAGMQATSPADSVFALDLTGLQTPDIQVWTAWDGSSIAGVGALRTVSAGHGEIKSMRTHPDHLRRGVGTAMLRHLIAQARARGISRLSLETGSGAAFEPAIALYRANGFREGPAFGDYRQSAFNRFFHLDL
ncbi:putative acetyltransferase [Sphingobium sp. OAS761]|uniref:GNAT family N-acetyltransferase n=1 Tax=Sphingobium sp. OAS761 TaxID=2817901 RepID=UPI00209EAEEB|nr:GNAT family N-acetyltransferase [Sphingobium sp. OAS761]MCP1470578.1 putative acetyltransferase [Sphingobium sp. OAS761]